MKDVIKTLVRQEIKKILGENEDLIKELVENTLLPELRAAVRESVHKALEDMTERTTEPAGNPPTDKPDVPQVDREARNPERGNRQSAIDNRQSTLGRYLYCIADSSEAVSLGDIGIEENEVYGIPYDDLCAIVHNCPARPYESKNQEIVKEWVIAHQKVVDAAWERFGTVIPIGFDTIVQGSAAVDPEENMKNWLKDDYDNLKAKMEKIRDRAEYGVQLFWDRKIMAEKISDESPEIRELNEEIKSKPKGIAYMYRQKLEGLLRKEIEDRADRYFKEFYAKITPHADDIRVEKTKKTEDEEKQMLLNLSCLLTEDGSKKLGEELEQIDALEGFSVRYTGPWPPYTFV